MALLRLYSLPFSRSCAAVEEAVAALAVGEDLDALDEAGRAAGERDAADLRGCGGERAQRAGEVLRVVPRRDVAGVARLQLVAQALHQLILGSGGDFIHTHFESCGEGKLFF